MRCKLLPLFALAVLSACTPQQRPASAATAPQPDWAFQASDVPVDPGYRFGRLPNGMRYIIRQNTKPQGTAVVRMRIAAGSLDESDAEQGFAHFVEHMAFNGSRNVPEGEMLKLLERKGLAFGADTNASTGHEQTVYSLDLPEATPDLLATSLMLMRETASELTIDPAAVERERGVVLAEMRDRNSYAWRNFIASVTFNHPESRYLKRMPIGTAATLNAATAEALRAFWQREYVPSQTTVVVIGDYDPAVVESAIRQRFADWQSRPAEPQPNAGPVDPGRKGLSGIHLDPALSEQIIATRHAPWLDEPDTLAQRRERVLRLIGYSIINRRLQRRILEADPPFRSAAIGSYELFKAGRSTNLLVNTVDSKWRRGLTEAATEYRRVMMHGFTAAELAEQLAQLRKNAQNDAASEATRSNGTLLGNALALIDEAIVPDTPANSLARLEAFIPQINPTSVLAALRRELVPLDQPLLRFQGRRAPEGGAAALRATWDAVARSRIAPPVEAATAAFAYTDFGPAGAVVSDQREPALGIRQIRFANGVMLNLKRTELDRDLVLVRLNLDGGQMLQTPANPLAVQMFGTLPMGGLGKHDADQLQTILAGRTVGNSLGTSDETFTAGGTTTPADLELQLQLLAATLTDPGYRPAGEVAYRQAVNNWFAALRATPGSALGAELGGIVSDNDPRFALRPVEEYRGLSFSKLRTDIGDRLGNGALEIALVGDLDEDQAIALVARTLGTLPTREPAFRDYPEQRSRSFTSARTPRVLRHTGPKDQALLYLLWPTRDGEDPVAVQQLQLLDRVLQITITDTLREELGKAYSPGVSSETSRTWRGWGTIAISASLATTEVDSARAAIRKAITRLRDEPISADLIQRARAPMLEGLANRLKGNGGWMGYAERAQSKPDRIDRFKQAEARLGAVTAADLQALIARYLAVDQALEVLVLPEAASPH